MANKHQSKEFDRLIEVARTKGFRIVVRGFGDTFILYPEDKNKPMRVFHRGDKGVKPLESYLKKNSWHILKDLKDLDSSEKQHQPTPNHQWTLKNS